jgi:hypothetical protein
MPKKAPKESKPEAVSKTRPSTDPQTVFWVRRIIGHTLAGLALVGVVGGAFVVCKRYVEQRVILTDLPPRVVMKDQPKWMSDALAEQILSSIRPVTPAKADDHQLLVDRAALLANNPWVKKVKSVRRAYGNQPGDLIEIDCDYRAPVALVHWQDQYWYIDTEGVQLPDPLTPEQVSRLIRPGQPMFRIIDGVAQPPSGPGRLWQGGDIQAGIEMVALLADVEEVNDIVKIDVSNYAGRISPNDSQINLVTRDRREIRWGQPPSSKAFFVEQRAERKLEFLKHAKRTTGRVDLNQPWIDLRFDSPTVPDPGRASIGQ